MPPLSEIPRCQCRSDMENPCGPDSDCINRLMMYECHPAVCAAGSQCGNRRFQLREDVDSVPFRTEKRGWGLKTNVDVVKVRAEMIYIYVLRLFVSVFSVNSVVSVILEHVVYTLVDEVVLW